MTERRVVWPLGLAVLLVVLLALLARRWGAADGSPLERAPAAQSETTLPLPKAGDDEGAAAAASELPLIAVQESPTSAVAAPVADATSGSLLVRARWKADGSSASGINLQLLRWDERSPLLHIVNGQTDERGEWLLRDVLPGKVTAYSDRSEDVTGEVVAGQLNELDLELPPGVWVRGVVVDAESRPVPRAAIWLSDYGNDTQGLIVAQADDGGRFELRGVQPDHYVGARASGHTPSAVHRVTKGSAELELTLVVGAPGGTVHGQVRFPDGAPVGEALILVGPEDGWSPPDSTNDTFVRGRPPFRTKSDADGGFTVTDVPAGYVPVAVRADTWPCWTGAVQVEAGQTSEVEVELRPGAIVAGTVRNESGQPVAGADVGYGGYAEMDWVGDVSDSDGRYELVGLPAGSVKLRARLVGGAKDATTLGLAAGERAEWNPVLAVGLQVFGRVVDDTGAPAGGLFVNANNGQDWHGDAEVDSTGHFMISNCPSVPITVVVHDFRVEPPVLFLAVAADVVAGPDEVVLTVPSNRALSAALVGRFAYDDGTPASDVQALLLPKGSNSGDLIVVDADGAFRSEPKLPGAYRLVPNVRGQLLPAVEDLVLHADQTTDAGVIVLEKPGIVVVHATFPPGVDESTLQFLIARKGGDVMGMARRQGDGSYSSGLPAGDYDLVLERPSPPALVTIRLPFHIEDGRTVELSVAVELGVRCGVDVTLPYEPEHKPTVRARIIDSRGDIALEIDMHILEWAKSEMRRASRGFILKPDAYRFRLVLDGQVVLDEPMVVQEAGAEKVQHFDWQVD